MLLLEEIRIIYSKRPTVCHPRCYQSFNGFIITDELTNYPNKSFIGFCITKVSQLFLICSEHFDFFVELHATSLSPENFLNGYFRKP